MQNDLISRSALLKVFGDAIPSLEEHCEVEQLQCLKSCIEDLQNAPAVDAVEVVRCRDCKYRHDSCFAGNGNTYCDKKRTYFPLDGFCNYGERRGKDG